MTIKYLGHASFLIKAKTAKVITDPFDPKAVGLKFPKEEVDIVTISHDHQDHNFKQGVGGDPLIIDWPGEFEKLGVRVKGFKTFHDKKQGSERGENILYKIEADDLSILHCGDLGLIPEEDFIDQIGSVDILLVPVGGHYTISAEEAAELVKKIEPSIVIPMHYNREGLNPTIFKELTTLDEFLKKMGVDKIAAEPALTVKREDLEGEMRVVVLES